MTNAAIYARISQDTLGLGLGIDRQEADCRKLAASKDWPVGRVFVDNDVSAFDADRDQARAEAATHLAMLDSLAGFMTTPAKDDRPMWDIPRCRRLRDPTEVRNGGCYLHGLSYC
jgi:hypothetical protein